MGTIIHVRRVAAPRSRRGSIRPDVAAAAESRSLERLHGDRYVVVVRVEGPFRACALDPAHVREQQ